MARCAMQVITPMMSPPIFEATNKPWCPQHRRPKLLTVGDSIATHLVGLDCRKVALQSSELFEPKFGSGASQIRSKSDLTGSTGFGKPGGANDLENQGRGPFSECTRKQPMALSDRENRECVNFHPKHWYMVCQQADVAVKVLRTKKCSSELAGYLRCMLAKILWSGLQL